MRLQCNRGYTPEELLSVHLPAARVPKSLSLGPNIKRRLRMGRWMQRVWRRDSWIPHSTMSGCAKAC